MWRFSNETIVSTNSSLSCFNSNSSALKEKLENTIIFLSGRRVVKFWSIVSQKQPLTPKYIHKSSALEYICSLYHKESQYIAKLRRITIDLYKSRLVTIETSRNHTLSQHWIVFAIVERYVGILMNFLISKRGWVFKANWNSIKITISTILHRRILRWEDSVHNPQTLIPLKSWDSQLSEWVITFECQPG